MKLGGRAMAVALVLVMLLGLTGCALWESIFPPDTEDVLLDDAIDTEAGFRRTVLYFETDDGHMVPVMKLLPWEEGIGKAALSQLVDTDTNRISAAAMGLKNVVPPGVSFVLSISDDAVATVNILDLPELESAEAEQKLVTAVVNTLTEFPTIDQVTFLFDGKAKKALPHGTPVNETLSKLPLNTEPLPASAVEGAGQHSLTLYFPNRAASLQVPVTRTVGSEPMLMSAMQELVNGPADETLRACFPEGTQVLSATVTDGVAVVNLSKEFNELQTMAELEEVALESMQLTAAQFEGVNTLHLQVEGSDYESAALSTMAMPVYVNEYRY